MWGEKLEPLKPNPLGVGREFTQQPAIYPEDIFLFNWELKEKDSLILPAGHIPGFVSDWILYERRVAELLPVTVYKVYL